MKAAVKAALLAGLGLSFLATKANACGVYNTQGPYYYGNYSEFDIGCGSDSQAAYMSLAILVSGDQPYFLIQSAGNLIYCEVLYADPYGNWYGPYSFPPNFRSGYDPIPYGDTIAFYCQQGDGTWFGGSGVCYGSNYCRATSG